MDRSQQRSERELQAELHLPRGLGAEDAAKVRRERDAIWHVEIGAVEEIEYLPAKLDPRARGKLHILPNAHVDVGITRRQHRVPPRVAEREGRRKREHARVEPLRRRLRPTRVRIPHDVGTLRRPRSVPKLTVKGAPDWMFDRSRASSNRPCRRRPAAPRSRSRRTGVGDRSWPAHARRPCSGRPEAHSSQMPSLQDQRHRRPPSKARSLPRTRGRAKGAARPGPSSRCRWSSRPSGSW